MDNATYPWSRQTSFTISPAATMLSRCVAKGVFTQEQVDSSRRESQAFSPDLYAAEERIRPQRELSQVRLEIELLTQDQEHAVATQYPSTAQRMEDLQELAAHIQGLLRKQTKLRLKLKLLKARYLPGLYLDPHVHSYVVDLFPMMLDFIENLERYMTMLHTLPLLPDNVAQLKNRVGRLRVWETTVELLTEQVLELLPLDFLKKQCVDI